MVPEGHHRTALNRCHQDGYHQCKERTLALAAERFWWPGMAMELYHGMNACRWCKMFKGRRETTPLHLILVSTPLELVHINFMSIETEQDLAKPPKVNDMLVITDHYIHYTEAFVTPNQKAETMAKVLYDHFISIFGAPEKILCDWGSNFTSCIIQALCDMFGIEKIMTMLYHAQCNGQVERFHQTPMRMVGKVWHDHETD